MMRIRKETRITPMYICDLPFPVYVRDILLDIHERALPEMRKLMPEHSYYYTLEGDKFLEAVREAGWSLGVNDLTRKIYFHRRIK